MTIAVDELPAPDQPQLPAASVPMRKVFLRLDDGSLIARACDVLGAGEPPEKVVRLSVDQAAELGRASDKEVARLQAILTRVKQQYPSPLKAPDKRALQKQQSARADGGGGLPGGPWLPKCRDVFNKVLKHLAEHKDVFYVPVNPAVLPDYYQVIKEPLFLSDIEKRLAGALYQQPQDFYNDVRHHFANVKLYNPEDNPYRKIGQRAEDYFEQLWASTGFSTERTKRTTAGLAAPKFDPEKFEPPSKPRPARTDQGAGSKRSRDGAARAMSVNHHEVESGGHGAMHPGGGHMHPGSMHPGGGHMPPGPGGHMVPGGGMHMGQGGGGGHMMAESGRLSQQRIQEMGAYLSSEDLPEEHSNHLLQLLPPHMLAGLESGEIELDFEALDNETLLRIDAWLRTLPGAPNQQQLQQQQHNMHGMGAPPQQQQYGAHMGGGPPGHYMPPQPQPSVRVDSFEDDEDYEEEDTDDSD